MRFIIIKYILIFNMGFQLNFVNFKENYKHFSIIECSLLFASTVDHCKEL